MLRTIDANFNRAAEGLRVLEDISRFELNNNQLSQRFKELRHELRLLTRDIQQQLLHSRAAEDDVGKHIETEDQSSHLSAVEIATASAKRVQEALRVLEESARSACAWHADRSKHISPGLNSHTFREMRFAVYSAEKELTAALVHRRRAEAIKGVYVILDTQSLDEKSLVSAAVSAIRGGATVIQYRDKRGSVQKAFQSAMELAGICRKEKVLFIVNDYIDVALAINADGIHLGQDDLPIAEARRIIPDDMLLGCSANTIEEAVKAQVEGADYIAVGAIYKSPTKPEQSVVGINRLKEIKTAIGSMPTVAIGGITRKNLKEVFQAGADSAAIISAILSSDNVELATREMVSIYQQYSKEKAGDRK